MAAARQTGRHGAELEQRGGVVARHGRQRTRSRNRIWRRRPETRPEERDQAAGGGRLPLVTAVARAIPLVAAVERHMKLVSVVLSAI
jgi:hypothetical protein